jgi:hypothetical protein
MTEKLDLPTPRKSAASLRPAQAQNLAESASRICAAFTRK